MRPTAVFAALCAATVLSACQDPAGVGLGLIDQEGVDPNVRTIEAASLDTVGQARTAIGFADPNASTPQGRVLAGRVQDDVFGDASAVAYVDAAQPTIDSDLVASDVSAVWLELRRTYVYGDTTASVPLALSEINGDWQVDAYPSDTLFSTGAPLVTTEAVIADTLVRWDLPQSWVTANAALLIGDDFSSGFEGFALEVPSTASLSPGAVFGFSTVGSLGSGLRVVAADDTLFFPLAEVFTSVQREAPVATPASLVPVRAYSLADLRAAFPLDGIGSLPLARAMLTVPLERSYAESGTFRRPLAARSAVYGVRGDGDDAVRTYLGELQVSDEGDARITASTTFTRQLQAVLLDPEATYDRFEITPGTSPLSPILPVSLDVLPVARPPAGTPATRLTLTVIGQAS